MGIKILEVCHVTPSAGGAAEQILPLLYFDVAWIPTQPTQGLYFYDFPHSQSHFSDTTVPNLKNSLSLTLKHFLPLAGKIVFPLSSGRPFSHYIAPKDSVPLTISISDSDFSHLTANHAKDSVEFHELSPQLPPVVVCSSDSIKFSVLALRVTLFPRRGICIGVTNHHAVCDAHCLIGPSGFLQTWASISNLGRIKDDKLLPTYDRSDVQDADSLTRSFWDHVRLSAPVVHPTIPLPRCNLRGTFVLSEVKIQRLKKFLLSQTPAVGRASSYVTVTAHVWSCMAEAGTLAEEKVEEDELEYLSITVECRGRLTPPLPSTYFGNCSRFVLAQEAHGMLKGRDGFVAAAQAIAAAIERNVDNNRGVVAGTEEEYLRRRELVGKSSMIIGVSGSMRFDMSGVDYGWGEMRKAELLHIDYNGAMSLFKTKQGVEVGLSMPKRKMDAFSTIFEKKLGITSTL